MSGKRVFEATAVLAGAGLLALVVYAKLRPLPDDAAYVGSTQCASCHRRLTSEWSASLHTQMMRPADAAGVVVADFGSDDAGLRFDLEEAVWAIGGKWEQQFMGHDGEGETLLAGAWHRSRKRWDFKGWDGWQTPVPLRRCHGCHTVGLDTESGSFVEANIGCESCHGPGSWHVATYGLGTIHSSADAQVCGQCHTRGTTPSGEFFFPVGYRPGGQLDDHFRHAEPSPGQNSSYWWGNGHERKRHQEFTAWRQGGHADSLESLRDGYDGRFGAATEDCLRCHSGDYLLADRGKPDLAKAREGITCSVCHNVHGRLDELRMDCADCHTPGAFYHEPERNAGHVPCPESAEVDCVSCHMPLTVTTGGAYALHSHAPGIVSPRDALEWNMPSSCANGGCHAEVEPLALQSLYDTHYISAEHAQTP